MEIHCKVNVVNRLLPAAGQSGPSRLIWANVTFSKNKLEVVELTLTTSRSKSGTKYRITDNVEQIFAKFISQGKLTARFKQPQHDLCFSGEAKQMERIAHILKGGDANLQKGPLSILSPNTSSKVVIPKTKLNITSRADYPVVNSFPESLVTLKVKFVFKGKCNGCIVIICCLS
jgi:LRR-repeat protein 1